MSAEAVLALLLFTAMFFGLGLLAQYRRMPAGLWSHPLINALSFLGVSGVLFYYGLVEMMGRYGLAGLLGVISYTVVFIFAPLFIEPLRWISRSQAFSSIPDLLVYRFRSVRIGRIASLVLALASLPIAAAQLKSIPDTFFSGSEVSTALRNVLMAAMAALAILFLAAFSRTQHQRRAIPLVMACGGLLAIAALLLCGLLAVYGGFGSFAELNSWAESSGQVAVVQRFDNAYALILLFFTAPFIMPQLAHLLSLTRDRSRDLTSSWLQPLMLWLAALPVLPILWTGLNLQLEVPFHHYVSALPALLGQPWLHTLTLLAGLFISLGLVAVMALAVGKFFVTTFVAPLQDSFRDRVLDSWLERWRFRAAALWVLAALLFAIDIPSHSVTDLTITGMMGLTQLIPALAATLYLPKVNRTGCLAGLAVGMTIWAYGALLPLLSGHTEASPPLLGGTLVVGAANWPSWLLESLITNLLVTLVVSRLTSMSREERTYAHHTMVDSMPVPQRSSLDPISFSAVEQRLAEQIGPQASREVAQVLHELELDRDDNRPLALRMFRDRLNYNLSDKLGTFASERVVDAVMPLDGQGDTPVDDISLLETRLAGAGRAMSGLAAELNKLRIYHRQTLENLPVGVCSIARDREILLWNHSLASGSGISPRLAEGAKLTDLPAPWGELLLTFADSDDDHWPAHEVPPPPTSAKGTPSRWFHLHKYRVDDNSPVHAGNQIILAEDISERLRLIQELAHAERLTSVGRLAAGVAHEIGNPVTGISCLAQDLISESNDQQTCSTAEIILAQTERITAIVRTLIDFSRSDDNSDHGPVYLARPVDDAIQLLSLDKAAKAVNFTSSVPPDLLVNGDAHQLTQVFVNLLANARDASPENSTIQVEYEAGPSDTRLVHISDTGSGIPPELQERVLEPFFTTKEPGEGTGLGLSLVYSIVRLHRGTIAITSPLSNGRGTRITVALNPPPPPPLDSLITEGNTRRPLN
ncbi:MAG: ATP-binding protein [Porticoccaceae bacterium]|nr:ATP-binding protein [Porticoccaceae bacterium]